MGVPPMGSTGFQPVAGGKMPPERMARMAMPRAEKGLREVCPYSLEDVFGELVGWIGTGFAERVEGKEKRPAEPGEVWIEMGGY